MSIANLLKNAADAGVFLYVENQELRFKLTVSQFPENIKAKIVQNKPAIIEFLSQLQDDASDNVEEDIQPIARDSDTLPLSFEQQRFWFMDQLEGGSAHYNMPFPIEIKGAFDVARAEQVLSTMIARHEILRTTYHWAGEKVVQKVNLPSNFKLNRVQLSVLVNNKAEQRVEVNRIFKEDAEKCFHLGEDLMLRGVWIALNDNPGQEHGILLLNIHHIASDEQSQDVLKDELLHGYMMLSQGQPIQFKPLAYQYADYAAWQRNNMTPKVLKSQIDYWKNTLNGIPELHAIPTDYPRPPVQTYQGSAVSQTLNAGTVKRLKQACLSHDVTPYIFIETVYGMLLSRYCNNGEVVIGSPYNARNRESMYPLLGCFLNNVLIRNQFDVDASFASHLAATKKQIVTSLANTLVPYDMIVAELGHSRSLSYSPVNQLRFSFFDKTGEQEKASADLGIELVNVKAETTTAKFDLILTATLTDGGIDISWIYNTDIFKQSTIQHIANSFEVLLNSALDQPETALGALPCLTSEQAALLQQWSQGPCSSEEACSSQETLSFQETQLIQESDSFQEATENPQAQTVIAQFEAQAEATPNATALHFGDESLSFAQLNQKANQLAGLISSTLTSGDDLSDNDLSAGINKKPLYIGLLLNRGMDTVVATLAALKARVPYVPMDTANPTSRIHGIIDDANLALVLTHSDQLDVLSAAQQNEVLVLDSPAVIRDLAGASEHNLSLQVQPSDEAYVIYTSGSTGKPKGVVVEHRALANFAAGFDLQLNELNLAQNSPWLWNASYAFDASLKGIAALSYGRSVVLTSEQQSKDPTALTQLVKTHNLAVLNLPPLLMAHVIAPLESAQLTPHLMVSGDAVGAALWQQLVDYVNQHQVKIINAYGPTEATVNATYTVVDTQTVDTQTIDTQTETQEEAHHAGLKNTSFKLENIGYPMLNTQTYVLSASTENGGLHSVPVGGVGELFIGGSSLAKGYLNPVDLSQDAQNQGSPLHAAQTHASQHQSAFITHPVSQERLYRTGDLVRYGDNGQLQFVGRADHQVKIRGYRMELGEITQAVLNAQIHGAHAIGVEKATVLAVGEGADKHLVAFVVLTQSTDDAEQALAQSVNAQLPEYMRPTRYVILDAMPLTSGGKVDTSALLHRVSAKGKRVENAVKPSADSDAKTGANSDAKPDAKSDVKSALRAIWMELLNLDDVENDDNFFVIGGHSILALNMIHEIDDQFGVEVGIGDLYANLELADLAQCIEELLEELDESAEETTSALSEASTQTAESQPLAQADSELNTTGTNTDSEKVAPLSFSQQRLFFIDSLQGATPEYNMPVAVKVTGALDIAKLNAVFTQIIERHEVLRTVYRASDSGEQGVQVILPMSAVNFGITVQDLRNSENLQSSQAQQETGREAECIEQRLARVVAEEVMKPFNLREDLMFRANFFQTGENEGVLTFNAHHIASDGWSMQVIMKEFYALYQNASLAPLTMQYADYARWQRESLEGETLEKQLNYWDSQLDNLPVLHSMPLSYPRPENKQFVGAVVSDSLSADLAQRLQKTAQGYQLTPFMFLHGALSALLSRHSNNADIVVGTPVANRTQAALEPLVGFFVNTLALRVNTDFANLNDYFDHVRQVHVDAQANQDVPFEQLVDRLNPPRSKAHSPLFQIMMTMNADFGVKVTAQDRGPSQTLTRSGLNGEQSEEPLHIEPYHAELNQAKFDLHVGMNLTEKGVDLHWTYDVSLFSKDDIQTLNDHFVTLLNGLADTGEQTAKSIHDLPMLSDSEMTHLVKTLNATDRDYDRDKCIHELFEIQAAEKPEHTALIFEAQTNSVQSAQSLSYEALNHKANQLAHYLRAQYSITPDTKIGLNVNRSMEMVISILAILKAGAAYVSLDPSYPKERIQAMVDDAQMEVVLTARTANEASAALAGFNGHLVDVTGISTGETHLDLAQYSAQNLSRDVTGVSPNSLAYVIYTSGSTGKPKGVMIEHRSVNNLTTVFTDIIGPEGNKVALGLTSINFDISIIELYLSFKAGATLVLAKEQDAKDPEQIAHLVETHQIDIVQATPSTWKMLMDSGWRYAKSFDLFVGGEALTQSVLQGLFEHFPHARIFNVYGPTEATVWSSYAQLVNPATNVGANHTVDIHLGKPIGNTQFYILGEGLMLQPQGVPGELYIGGEGLGRGYVNAEMTAERFVQNPFYDAQNPSSSSRLYRTGDLVRYNQDGNLEFVGRADDQVKIRGFRIELGEVEQQLMQVEGVDSAVVVAKGPAGAQKLVGYIKLAEAKPQESVQAERIQLAKSSLKAVLPEYMVPSFILCVQEWPMTINGKVNKRALPEPSDDLQITYVAPQSEMERGLAAVWADVLSLNVDKVSAVAGFFELGGNSLLVISLASKIRAHFNVNVALANLMESPSISELALMIQSLQIQGQNAQNQNGNDAPSCVVPLAQGTTQQAQENNLFCVHPLGGNAADYVELASHLNSLTNVYGVQSAHVYGDEATKAAITDKASLINTYVQAIKAVQKSGPYHLMGYSMGGNIAYEIACQLREEGEEIGYFGLIDNKPRQIEDIKAKENWCDFLQEVLTGFFPDLNYNWRGLGEYSPGEGIDILADEINKFNLSFTVDDTLIRPYLRYFVGIGAIWDKMFPAQSDLDIYLARAHREESTSATLGWEKLTSGNVNVTELSGTHGEIFQKPYSVGNISAIKAQLVSSGKLSVSQAVDGEVAV